MRLASHLAAAIAQRFTTIVDAIASDTHAPESSH